jgi:acylpyruvate hydrolase
MRFASVIHAGLPLAVAIDGEHATPLLGVTELGAETPSSLLRSPRLDSDAVLSVSQLRFRPVIPDPAKVICIGLNYRAHIQETGNKEHAYPVLFSKWASTLTGAYDDLRRPPESSAMDYEGELAVVIGTPTRRVSPQRAADHIAGYTVANDITMRDYQYKTHQYLPGKSWDASTPVGPCLVSPDEIADVSELVVRTTVNGEVVQEASTATMIYDVPTLISTISEFTALSPGDLILTGTPAGVGFRRDPQLLLGDGDVVLTEIEGIGRLENHIVAES